MSEKDEKLLPWTNQSRREYKPWRNRRQRTSWMLYYHEILESLTPATGIWVFIKLMIMAFGVFVVFSHIFGPSSTTDLRTSPISGFRSAKPKTTPNCEPQPKRSHPLSMTFPSSQLSHEYPLTYQQSFEELDELCKKHDMLVWPEHLKRRKVYELIYINTTNPKYYEELHIHIGQRYNHVDYFILAASQDDHHIRPEKIFGISYEHNFRPYHEKIIKHIIQPIQPATKTNSPEIPAHLGGFYIDVIDKLMCRRRSALGDVISFHYNATFVDGTLIGSSRDNLRGWPVSYTIGHHVTMLGLDRGLRGMCVGEKRMITISPEFGYGGETVGAIPANSTLKFEVEALAIEKADVKTKSCGPFTKGSLTDVLENEHIEHAYNAMYLQVLPLLPEDKKPSLGDIIIISTPDQVPTLTALATLQHCDFPNKVSIKSVVQGYRYRGENRWKSSRLLATFYAGEDTILPRELRAFRASRIIHGQGKRLYQETEYCGPCYGAVPRPSSDHALSGQPKKSELKEGCCVLCEEVRDAYETLPWAVGTADEQVEQCVRERRPWDFRYGFD